MTIVTRLQDLLTESARNGRRKSNHQRLNSGKPGGSRQSERVCARLSTIKHTPTLSDPEEYKRRSPSLPLSWLIPIRCKATTPCHRDLRPLPYLPGSLPKSRTCRASARCLRRLQPDSPGRGTGCEGRQEGREIGPQPTDQPTSRGRNTRHRTRYTRRPQDATSRFRTLALGRGQGAG